MRLGLGIRQAGISVVCAAALFAVSGCREAPALTGLRLATLWDDGMDVDQIEFHVIDTNDKVLVQPDVRPNPPNGPLKSGVDVVIYFKDDLGGTDVYCEVRGFSAGSVVGAAKLRQRLVARTIVPVMMKLDGSSTAMKQTGQPCTAATDCLSRVCASGVCCDRPCTGVCTSCNLPGRLGTCGMVPGGTPHADCADQGAATCGFDGSCNGAGGCRRYPAGTRCAVGMCSMSSINAAQACDGLGTCVLGAVVTCAPYNCDPAGGTPRCFDKCTTGADCIAGRECIAGSCGKKLDGASCADANECTSGFCADGICCDSKCEGACVTCAQAGFLGTCRPVAVGVKDPRNVCKDSGAANCGQTGTCDGKGACARYPAGSICQQPSCMGGGSGVLLTSGRCDGISRCIPGIQLPCFPYLCRNNACVSSCTSNADCAPERMCDANKSCGKKGLGQACGASGDCESNFCVDGVCCNEACAGNCRSCTAGMAPGMCTVTAAGVADPRNGCQDQGAATCLTDGTCNGAGACRRYAVGTMCAPGSCNVASNVRTLPSMCDATARCAPGSQVSCGNYRCNGPICFTACAGDANCWMPNTCNGGACSLRGSGAACSSAAQCIAPFTCIGSVCQLRPLGNPCTADNQCGSGQCTEGVCCNLNACSRCQSCKVSGFVGYCHPLPPGSSDPTGQCTAEGTDTCGRDGTCDGAGGCRLHMAGTVCDPASCNGRYRIRPRTCDGTGDCTDNGFINCSPYMCNPNTVNCYTSCDSDSQCYGTSNCRRSSCN